MIAGSDTENTEISRAAALLEEYSTQRAFYENALAALPVRLLVVDSALRSCSTRTPPTAGSAVYRR